MSFPMWGAAVGAVAVSLMAPVSAAAGIPAEPEGGPGQRSGSDPCWWFNDPAGSEEVPDGDVQRLWFDKNYDSLRRDVSTCQGKAMIPVSKLSIRKAKRPKNPGQFPAFWAYVTGSQAEGGNFKLREYADLDTCHAFGTATGFSFFSQVAVPVLIVPPSTGGNGSDLVVPSKASVVKRAWGDGPDCPRENEGYTTDMTVSINISSTGFTLRGTIGDGVSMVGDDYSTFTFSKAQRKLINNPKRGVLTFTVTHAGGGDANTPGQCQDITEVDYSCAWAESRTLTLVLVRADMADLARL